MYDLIHCKLKVSISQINKDYFLKGIDKNTIKSIQTALQLLQNQSLSISKCLAESWANDIEHY